MFEVSPADSDMRFVQPGRQKKIVFSLLLDIIYKHRPFYRLCFPKMNPDSN